MVDPNLTVNERKIIGALIDAHSPVFFALQKQVNVVDVIERNASGRVYSVLFRKTSQIGGPIIGKEANIDISDVRIRISESDAVLYARLTVLNGFIHRLKVAGDYDFSNDFTINEIIWVKGPCSNDDLEEMTILSSKERRLDSAVTYHPMYK